MVEHELLPSYATDIYAHFERTALPGPCTEPLLMNSHLLSFAYKNTITIKVSNNNLTDVLPVAYIGITGWVETIEIYIQSNATEGFIIARDLGVYGNSTGHVNITFHPYKDVYAVQIIDHKPTIGNTIIGNITGIHIGVCIADGMYN